MMKRRLPSVLLAVLMVAMVFVLTACDDLIGGEHQHEWSDWETIKNPDCQNPGIAERFCDCGETQSKSIPITTNHKESDWIVDTEPTCISEGIKHKECTICKTFITKKTIDKTNHTYGEWIEEVPATTETEGTLGHYHCSVCEKNFDTEKKELDSIVIPKFDDESPDPDPTPNPDPKPHEHTESDWIVDEEATCTEEGSKHKECTDCGETTKIESISINSSNHSYGEWIAEVPATTENEGTLGHYHCSLCEKNFDSEKKELESIVIPKLDNEKPNPDPKPHEHTESDWIIDKEATCTKEGSKHKECTGCGETTKTDSIPIDPNKHSESDWIIDEESTCIKKGFKHTECLDCEAAVKFAILPIDSSKHTEVIDPAVDATCTETGILEGKHCSACNEVIVAQEIAPLIDHNYKNDNCSMCGATSEKYFNFIYDDYEGTYSIEAKDVKNMPNEVVIPSRYNKKLVDSIDTFQECYSLTSIVIPDSVTSIGWYAFKNCSSLTSIMIPDSVTSLGWYAFLGCSNLTSIVIPNRIPYIGESTFQDCYSLTSVEIGDNVTTIDLMAFYGCSSLTNIVIPDSVTSIGNYAFKDCTSLTNVTIPDSVTKIGGFAFNNTAYYNNESNWVNGVLYIGNHLIEAKNTISGEYVIKDGIITIAPYAFYGCSNLTSIVIPDSVTSIGYEAFYGCFKIADVYIYDITAWLNIEFGSEESHPNYGNDNIYLHILDKNDNEVTKLVIPSSITNIPNYAFYNAKNLTIVTIPKNITSIGNYAFSYCRNLTSVTIPYNVTSIGDYAFSYCYSLANVVIPDSVISIGYRAFSYCRNLTSVTIPDSVTFIGDRTFYFCSNLTSVVIGDSVTSIGAGAFSGCSSLTDVYYTGSEEDWAKISIGTDNSYLTDATIHYNYVPKE